MIVRGHDFSDIYDLVGVRILVDTVRDCYAVLGTLHATWNPLPGRFKDYIAMPKFNMYQSLHTTVIGPEGKTVEVQIRTQEMHRAAEYGIAAHWRYKQNEVGGKLGPDDLGWLRQLVEWQRETEDPGEFLESLRYDLGTSEVFVFTPRGRRDRAAVRVDPGRLRLRGAHRARPPMRRRAGERPARAAGQPAEQRRLGRGVHAPRPRAPGRAGTG